MILRTLLAFFVFCGVAFSDDSATFIQLQNHITRISEKIRDSVVHIKVEVQKNNKKHTQFGSGFVLNNKGHIFTNHHVIDEAISVIIKFQKDPTEYKATVLGSDESTDVALLQVGKDAMAKLHPVKFGSGQKAKVGQWVIAVGNPFGFDRTVSFGIISAKGRNFPNAPVLNEFIQTDAMIAPGSSGGPLLNLKGEVIGINSRASTKGGIGFTIPIEVALEVRDKILKEGKIKRGWLGLAFQPLSLEIRRELKLPEGTGGALVSYVSGKSNLYNKVRPFELVLSINNKSISAIEEKDLPRLERVLSRLKIGSSASLKVFNRDTGKTRTVTAVVQERPPKDSKAHHNDLGFSVKDINERIYNRYMLAKRNGVYVSYVETGSSAKQAGLLVGDIILSVNKVAVKEASLVPGLFKKKEAKNFLLSILRGREFLYIYIKS